jgi:acyl-CoA dehydrogenase
MNQDTIWREPRPLADDLDLLRAEVREFLRVELNSGRIETSVDSWLGGFDPEFSRALGQRGWLGITWPTEYGGRNGSSFERFVVVEELLAAGAPVTAHWVADRQTGAALLKYGTEDQRRRFMPSMARGECYFAIGMSEPDAGSDLAAVRSRATRVDGGWSITGTKLWTSSAHRCHFMTALVRTAEPTGTRHAGLSQLIVELASPGIEIRPVRLMTGEHHFNEVHMNEVFVPDGMVLGEIGDGWSQVVSELAHERSGPERFLSTLPLLIAVVEHVGLSPDPHAAQTIGRLVAQLFTIRQLSLGVACALDDGNSPEVEAAVVKDLGTRFESEVIEGARSVIECEPDLQGSKLARLLAEAILHSPGFTLRGGTNEILRTIIAKNVGLS